MNCKLLFSKMEDSSFAFRGIPYARPPVGDLRFKYAQPLNQMEYCWNGTLLAHNATPTCLQILGNGTVTGKSYLSTYTKGHTNIFLSGN